MISEFESLSSASVLLPFPQERITGSNASITLFCPNLAALPMPHFAKASNDLRAMQHALDVQDVEAFNEVKRTLFALLKKQGEPVTQWNPMVLEFLQPDALKGKALSQINLEMVHLRSLNGVLSLEGCNLQGAYLLCANLGQACLDDADMSGADLRYADFSEATLRRTVLVETNLSHAKLCDTDFTEANLYCARLNSASIKQAIFRDANLRKSDLRNADFYQANLQEARLQQSDLREANLFMANLRASKLRHADLRGSNMGFAQLQEARLQNARLNDVNFNSADLSGADLQHCVLDNALFSRTVLNKSNFAATDLKGLDLSDCVDLENAELQGALIDEETLFPKGFKTRKAGIINQQQQMISFKKFFRTIFSLFS